jgi:hypothetical protein
MSCQPDRYVITRALYTSKTALHTPLEYPLR